MCLGVEQQGDYELHGRARNDCHRLWLDGKQMIIEAQESGGVERKGFCELGSITQFVVPEFLFLDARIAEQAEHLDSTGTNGNRLQVRLYCSIHSGRLAYGLGCG